MPENTQADSDHQKIEKKKKQILDPGMKRIFAVGVVVLLLLLVFTFAQASGRIPFFAQNFLSLLVLVAIAIQAYIYRKQWEVMEDQWKVVKEQADIMRRQAKSMDESVVFGLRAYVGVGGIRFDVNRRRVFIEIENIGKVPAKDIKLEVILRVEIPREFVSRVPLAQKVRRPFQFVQIDTGAEYGGTKLFRGKLPITFMIRLDNDILDNDQYALITAGQARVIVNGLITFHDGFNSGKKTPFSFRYFLSDNLWSPSPVPDLEGEAESEKQNQPKVTTSKFK